MGSVSSAEKEPVFVTLGPEGTDHERAAKSFIRLQGLEDAIDVELIEDIIGEGPDIVLNGVNKFLVLCSAHPKFHLVNERYPQKVSPVATFLHPTQHMSIVARNDVETPRELALVAATHGYPDLDAWRERGTQIVDAPSKPVIERMLLDGAIDAGLTFTRVAWDNPERFRTVEEYGEVDTSWTVFGLRDNNPNAGELVGIKDPGLFTGEYS